MRRQSRRTGMIMLEVLIAAMGSLMVGSALLALIKCTYTAQTVTVGENMTYSGAREGINIIADHLRTSQPFLIQASPALYSVISADAGASATSGTSVTCYILSPGTQTSTGDTERYYLAGGNLMRQQTLAGVLQTATTVLPNVTGLTFVYYTDPGATYTTLAAWPTVTLSSPATVAQLTSLAAIQVTVTMGVNGFSRQISSLIRLRNSPYR
jgi:hypothetical protein